MLRERSGDFIRSLVSENSGFDGEPGAVADMPLARCSRDTCIADIRRAGRSWRVLATRSGQKHRLAPTSPRPAPRPTSSSPTAGCRAAARPRWLKLDRKALESTGGLAIYLGGERRASTPSPIASARIRGPAPGASRSLQTASSLPDGSMKWKRRPPGKEKIGLGDGAAGLGHRIERRFEVVDPDHRQRRRQRFVRLAVEADIDVAVRGRRIIGAEIGELPAERLGVEGARQLMRRGARQLDIIDRAPCGSVAPDEAGKPALDADPAFVVALRLVGAVGGVEADHLALAADRS